MVKRSKTQTKSFGTGKRESHDASRFYQRFSAPEVSDLKIVNRPDEFLKSIQGGACYLQSSEQMQQLPDNSVGLVVTSPPYFVGKDYELAVDTEEVPESYLQFLELLQRVFAECWRVLESGGRIAVNVANLGRKPYRSLAADVIGVLQDLGFLLRGEVVWEKSITASGSCAWGSFASASNPVLRDMTERVIIASKGRFDRGYSVKERQKLGLPFKSSLSNDEFMQATTDVWRIPAESAKRVGHPAPFPLGLARRLINLYSFEGDVVLDPFMGSGTTLVAALDSGRLAVGYDTEELYLQMAKDRIHSEVGSVCTDSLEPAESTSGYNVAANSGMKIADLAEASLIGQGFEVTRSKKVCQVGPVSFDCLATRGEESFWVLIAGSFNVIDLQPSSEDILVAIGKASLSQQVNNGHKILLLLPELPAPGSSKQKLLKQAVPEPISEVWEINLAEDL